MLENRPIVVIAFGYILGIIMGLYCKFSIVPFYLLIILIYLICRKPYTKKFKLISVKRYYRYVKLIFTSKVIIIIIVSSILSNSITIYKSKQYELIWDRFDNIEITVKGKVISNLEEKQYKNIYTIKIEEINSKLKKQNLKRKKIYLEISKNNNISLEFGDEITIQGNFEKPSIQTNYKGFDYSVYLKSQNIYGTIKAKKITKLENNSNVSKVLNNIFLKLKGDFEKNFNKDVSSILTSMILGNTNNIDIETKQEFSDSNISHILAISGMHIGYIVIFLGLLGNILGKRKIYYYTIFMLTIYIFLIESHPSAIRATIMACLMIFSKIIYKKSDIYTNISISLLMLLIYNPFLILNSGLVLSYLGTIGIIIYSKIFTSKSKICNLILTSFSVYFILIPFLAIYFNKIPLLSLFTSIFIAMIAAPIIVFGFLFIILSLFNVKIVLINEALNFLVKTLLYSSKIVANNSISKMYVTTPSTIKIIIYYVDLILLLFFYKIYYSNKNWNFTFVHRIQNLVSLGKYKYRENKNKAISIILIFVLFFSIIKISPKNLKIHFIDVGQGDSCLIVTPHNKKVLIDGGGSETGNFDIGKKVLLPYLLARGIKTLDYIVVSHFDTDHVGGLLTVMEELKVKQIIVSKQGEDSENYRKFREIVKKKKIRVQVVEKGNRIKIEKDLNIDILWPYSDNLISENVLNNNSIVCKLNYKSFSMLFTGDIEEIAEKQILKEYENNLQVLKSNVLKVAHHGSKTSSIGKFIEAVKPKISLIGVGENNTFGHPNEDVIKRFESMRNKNI